MNSRFAVERLSRLVSEIKPLRYRRGLPLAERKIVSDNGSEGRWKPIHVGEMKGEWKRRGDVPNVVFSCGQVMSEDTLYVYYGGADMMTGVAEVNKEQVLAFINGEKREAFAAHPLR